ncbi:MAG TPA: response regulator [Rhodopila sp.]|jgi:two-component system chemotaxis response regulator CheB|nr:response regulator [Rhodopila sp.]
MAKSVFIVDDSSIMRRILKDLIESDPDLSVVGMAENGKIALQVLRELKPDLVLLDLEMPEMSGLDTLKRLALVSRAKVIIVSSIGQAGAAQAVQARKLGAVDVIAKPSGPMSLDLKQRRGSEIVDAARRALGLELPASA